MNQESRTLVRGFTVDGATSRDLDDGIWVEKVAGGWNVEISIADVSSGVTLYGTTDKIAFERAVTRYFAAGNRPMLPRDLAENHLSLLPGRPRKTITFFISLDTQLNVKDLRIEKNRFENIEQLSHKQVDSFLDDEACEHHQWWVDCFELAQSLLNKRRNLGALAVFDLKKGLVTNEDGEVKKMPHGQHYRAHLIVQELMILTNHQVTAYLIEKGVTLLMRNHTTRTEDVRAHYLEQLAKLLLTPTPELLEQLGVEARHVMNRARYSPEQQGHFALNLPVYAHWTSPIRRFADLVNHRILHAWLDGKESPYSRDLLLSIGDHLNTVSDQIRDGSDEIHRERRLNTFLAAGKQKLLSLEAGDFSSFIKRLVDDSIVLDQMRKEVVLKRIESGSAAVADITRILFAGTQTDAFWCELKEAALQWLQNNQNEVFQIVGLAHQLCDFPAPESLALEMTQTGAAHSPTFNLTASVEYDGATLSSTTFSAAKRRDAEQMAICNLIATISGVSIKAEGVCSVTNSVQAVGNAKGRLFEFCQKQRIAIPTFKVNQTGEPHKPSFTCVGTMRFQGKAVTSQEVKGASRKDVEQLASADLLVRLQVEEVVEQTPAPTSVVTDWNTNPIGALQEWCQQQPGGNLPDYKASSSGPLNAPVFKCVCSLIVQGSVKEWSGLGTTKQVAKKNAAEEACKALLAK